MNDEVRRPGPTLADADLAGAGPAPLDEARLNAQLQLMLRALSLEDRLSAAIQAHADRARPAPDDSLSAEHRASLRWYLGGLALVGASIGLFAGWSASPVIATVLPILFGVIGAGGGYYLASRELSAVRARLLGKGLLAFIVPTVPAAMLGISMRTSTGVLDMLPTLFTSRQTSFVVEHGDRSAEYTYRLAKLRASLVELGSPAAERASVLREAARVFSQAPPGVGTSQAAQHLRALAAQLAATRPAAVSNTAEAADPVDAAGLALTVTGYADELALWQQVPVRELPREELFSRLTEMSELFECRPELGRFPRTLLGSCRQAAHLMAMLRVAALAAYGSASQQLMMATESFSTSRPSGSAGAVGPVRAPAQIRPE